MKILLVSAVLTGVATGTAAAGPSVSVERPAPATAVSLHLLSIGTRGLAIEGERHDVGLGPRLSVAAGLAMRAPALGDYSSRQITGSGELRWWLTGDAPWADFASRAMIGAYLGARIDLGHTSTTDAVDGSHLGSTVTVAESLTAGYRFAFWHRVELTPSLTLGMRHEIDRSGRLAPWTRASLGFGLTAGALF